MYGIFYGKLITDTSSLVVKFDRVEGIILVSDKLLKYPQFW